MSFAYHEPASAAEAVELAGRYGAAGRFLAGGTDLIIQIHRGQLAPQQVISLHRIPQLSSIAVNDHVTLGALVTHRNIERCLYFQGHLRGLVEGAQVIGGHQVRNVATVGGNLVNASPAADMVPVLLSLGASVTCLGSTGERMLLLEEFLAGPHQTQRRPDELVTHIRFPLPPKHSATAFMKAGRRKAMEISVVCVAASLTLDANLERCLAAGIALGAVAPTTLRAHAAEQCLIGAVLTPDRLALAGRLAAAACQPLDDVRASAPYRRLLVETLVPGALQRCLERLSEEV